MPPRRSLNPSGLGRAIINRKVKDAREMHDSGRYTTDVDTSSHLQSVTQERDLDEFLSTAQLAGVNFTAERRNVRIVQSGATGPTHNPYLLSEQDERSTLEKHQDNKARLRVPRRPPWNKSMVHAQLDKQEREAFLEWRRGLAQLQEEDKFLLTPFERNLEVWRQLWRVLERSHLVVQIVDARNPLRFRCEDLEAYVKDVEGPEGEVGTGKGKRRNLLLINKADLLTVEQRRLWADYFDSQEIPYAFFSAANANALQEARRNMSLQREQTVEDPTESNDDGGYTKSQDFEASSAIRDRDRPDSPSLSSSSDIDGEDNETDSTSDELHVFVEQETLDAQDPRYKVLSVLELEDLFTRSAPGLSTLTDSTGSQPTKLVVGLVGYPNVGKSSTINALLGEKKVSVSSTPGKTKHFQTINLSSSITLCDCPGLVFPQFATTKAELVCDGVLPIDQMREYSGPIALVVKRIPQTVLEATYGLTIKTRPLEEGGDGTITAEDFLIAYAIARGFMRSGQGMPDEARAARYILKDYVNAKLLYCDPPPTVSEPSFNERTHELALVRVWGKKKAPVTRVTKDADTFITSEVSSSSGAAFIGGGKASKAIDQDFFTDNALSSRPFIQGSIRNGQEFSRGRLYPHQNAVADDGTPLDPSQARFTSVIANAGNGGKKHHKKNKRVKQRSGRGYD